MANLFDRSMAQQRRATARREMIANTLRLHTLPQPRKRDDDPFAWDERDYIQRRNDDLAQVIAETHQVTNSGYTT